MLKASAGIINMAGVMAAAGQLAGDGMASIANAWQPAGNQRASGGNGSNGGEYQLNQ